MKTQNFRSFGRKSLLALAVAALLGGVVAAPAMADEHGYRGRPEQHQSWGHRESWGHQDWRAHEVRDHRFYGDRYHGDRYHGYAAPAYRSPSLSLFFPFR